MDIRNTFSPSSDIAKAEAKDFTNNLTRYPDIHQQVGPQGEVHLVNFRDRIMLEYRILKAATRHLLFTLGYFVTLCYIGVSTDNELTCRAQSVIQDVLQLGKLDSLSSLGEHLDWLNLSILQLVNSTAVNTSASVVRVGPSVFELRKYMLGPCPLKYSAWDARVDITNVQSCLSEADNAYFGETCSRTNGTVTCPSACVSTAVEPIPVGCLAGINGEAAYSLTDLVIVGQEGNLTSNLTILPSLDIVVARALVRTVVYVPKEDVLGHLAIEFRQSPFGQARSKFQANLFSPPASSNVALFVIAVVLTSWSVLIDVRNVRKRWKLGRMNFVNFLKHLNSFSLVALLGLRWYYANVMLDLTKRVKPLVELKPSLTTSMLAHSDFQTLIWWKEGVGLGSILLIFASSIRLLRILSLHPRTSVLASISTRGRRDWATIGVACILALVFYTIVGSILTKESTGEFFFLLIQVPFGVWPFTHANRVVLILFGLVVFYYFFSLLQIRVAQHYKAYREREIPVVAQGVLEDLFEFMLVTLIRMRDSRKWPHRLVLICALDASIKNRKGNTHAGICFSELRNACMAKPEFGDSVHEAKLRSFHSAAVWDEQTLESIWTHYSGRFAKTKADFLHAEFEKVTVPRIEDLCVKVRQAQLAVQTLCAVAQTESVEMEGEIAQLETQLAAARTEKERAEKHRSELKRAKRSMAVLEEECARVSAEIQHLIASE